MHGIITDMTCPSAMRGSTNGSHTMLAIYNDSVEASQGNDLRMSNGRYSDKGQKRFLAISEFVEQSQSWVLDLGGMCCGSGLDRHLG